jgi:phosphatidylinositol glycan class N
MYGGALMFAVGVLYLLFETSIIANAKSSDPKLSVRALDTTSRNILGVQIGLVALAMIVTRSSVITLRARQGLGAGNIYVGWITLGMHILVQIDTQR